ncbi:hypothetical protein FANTH_14759, partial [Fusarium anthophilum]
MKTSIVILTVFAAMAAASPLPEPEPQCAGCEPSGKGSSGASSNSNSNNTNNNSNSNSNSNTVTVGASAGGNGSGSGGSGGGNGSGSGGGSTGAHTCDECIAFCTGRADLLDALCKAIVCGIDSKYFSLEDRLDVQGSTAELCPGKACENTRRGDLVET